jgi:3-oxocholest-4-en-26-oyl-CoA dehydrogenase beta subunit
MDFAFDEIQEGIRALCKQVFTEQVTEDSLRAIGDDWFHVKAWKSLAQSQVLGLAIKEDVGGAGLGLLELCLLLQQVGRTVAPVPALSTLVLGALPIDQFASDETRNRLLPGVIAGETFLTGALETDAEVRDGKLYGEAHCVPDTHLASHVVVATPQGLFLTEVGDREVQWATNDEPLAILRFDGAAGELIAEGPGPVEWMRQRSLLAHCAIMLGVAERAMFLTASYVTERQQFGVPIGTFQAVSQRAGDMYIDATVMRSSLWNAAWRIDEDRDPQRAICIARYWASQGGHRIVAAAQHLHGGMGFDRDYPLHRYFLWAKRLEFSLGGASAQLAQLGDLVAQGAR